MLRRPHLLLLKILRPLRTGLMLTQLFSKSEDALTPSQRAWKMMPNKSTWINLLKRIKSKTDSNLSMKT